MNENEEKKTPPAPPRPLKKRRRRLKLSFVLCVVLPSLLGALYIWFGASERYVSGAGFAVRSMKTGGGTDLLGSFTGLAGTGSTTSDAYIVLKYLESRDLIDRLRADVDFEAIYGGKEIDPLSRVRPNLDAEMLLDYWERRITTSFDPTSGIITFDVQAFDAENARQVAGLALNYCRELVNGLSERARADAVSYAEEEVQRAEKRRLDALRKLRDFRNRTEALDPAASASAQIGILAGLEAQWLEVTARADALSESVDADAPSLTALRRKAEALEKRIEEKGGGIHMTGSDEELTGLLAEYEELQVENEFARKAYAMALASLETARIEAGRRQRYLAVFSEPALPEHPLYPRVVLHPILLVVLMSGLWGVGALMVYAVRDHLT
jgi:capsular polysaccharide transport system permease protein